MIRPTFGCWQRTRYTVEKGRREQHQCTHKLGGGHRYAFAACVRRAFHATLHRANAIISPPLARLDRRFSARWFMNRARAKCNGGQSNPERQAHEAEPFLGRHITPAVVCCPLPLALGSKAYLPR